MNNITQSYSLCRSVSSFGMTCRGSRESLYKLELASHIRQDAVTCNFSSIKDLEDEMLRQRFICSVNNEAVLKALFKRKEEEITFAKAVQVAWLIHYIWPSWPRPTVDLLLQSPVFVPSTFKQARESDDVVQWKRSHNHREQSEHWDWGWVCRSSLRSAPKHSYHKSKKESVTRKTNDHHTATSSEVHEGRWGTSLCAHNNCRLNKWCIFARRKT